MQQYKHNLNRQHDKFAFNMYIFSKRIFHVNLILSAAVAGKITL